MTRSDVILNLENQLFLPAAARKFTKYTLAAQKIHARSAKGSNTTTATS
jgi:hypothetical protein